MSNYNLTARNKGTGEVVTVEAIDNYYGSHKYGYKVSDSKRVQSDLEFPLNYEVVEPTHAEKTVEDYVEEFARYYGHDQLVSVEDKEHEHAIDWLRTTLTEAIDQARKEEREKIVKLVQKTYCTPEHTDTHVCGFYDGQRCDCYNEAMDNIIAHLTK